MRQFTRADARHVRHPVPSRAFASVVLITCMSTLASADHAASQFGLLTNALICESPL
jgi:hypothetical protein